MADSDLLHHHRVLKQFLDISDDSTTRAKSNSSRAARAREKLLRLSQAQFRELSTDVYDELRRRIDESRSEPDFLLPKLTFHPKRNQARQKLSLLPQSRFKDLVSDISFEIERRNLHCPALAAPGPELPDDARVSQALALAVPSPDTPAASAPYPLSPPQHRSSVASHDRAPRHFGGGDARRSTQSVLLLLLLRPAASAASAASSAALQDDIATPDLRRQIPEQAIGIQPTTVVPAKADMTWSSDEELENGAVTDGNSISEEPRQLMLSSAFATPPAPEAPAEEPSRDASSWRPTATNEHGKKNTQVLDKGFEVDHTEKLQGDARHASFPAAYDSLFAEHNSLIAAHAEVQSQLAALTDEHANVRLQLEELKESDRSAHKSFTELSEKHSHVLAQQGALDALMEGFDTIMLDSHYATLTTLEKIQAVKNELEELKMSNASLRLENQSLKSSPSIKPKSVVSSPITLLHTARDDIDSDEAPIEINTELRKLYQKLDQIPKNVDQNQFSRREAKLKSEIVQWQEKYALIKAGMIINAGRKSEKTPNLAKFCSPDGILSYKTAVDFFSSVDLFYAVLDVSDADADLFFERISSVAMIANKIANQATQKCLDENGHADSIRESANHALTATRYFVIYPTLMPKVISERAVSELAFAVCDSISALKFNSRTENSSLSTESHSDTTRSKGTADNAVNVKPLVITLRKQPIFSRLNGERQHSGNVTSQDQLSDLKLQETADLISSQIKPESDKLMEENLPGTRNAIKYSPKESSRDSTLPEEEVKSQYILEERPESQSLPARDRDTIESSTEASVSEPKQPLSAKLSIKNFFSSKARDGENLPEQNSASGPEMIERKEIEERSLEAKSETASGFSNEICPDNASNGDFAKAFTKLTSPGILDKVRRFENDTLEQEASRSLSEKSRNKVEKKFDISSKVDHSTPKGETLRSTSLLSNNTPSTNKSIFQSLRERFTHDPQGHDIKATESDEDEDKKKDLNNSDSNEKNSTSLNFDHRNERELKILPERNSGNQSKLLDEQNILPLSPNKIKNESATNFSSSTPSKDFSSGIIERSASIDSFANSYHPESAKLPKRGLFSSGSHFDGLDQQNLSSSKKLDVSREVEIHELASSRNNVPSSPVNKLQKLSQKLKLTDIPERPVEKSKPDGSPRHTVLKTEDNKSRMHSSSFLENDQVHVSSSQQPEIKVGQDFDTSSSRIMTEDNEETSNIQPAEVTQTRKVNAQLSAVRNDETYVPSEGEEREQKTYVQSIPSGADNEIASRENAQGDLESKLPSMPSIDHDVAETNQNVMELQFTVVASHRTNSKENFQEHASNSSVLTSPANSGPFSPSKNSRVASHANFEQVSQNSHSNESSAAPRLNMEISQNSNENTKEASYKAVTTNDKHSKSPLIASMKSPSFKVRKIGYEDQIEDLDEPEEYEDAEDDSYESEEDEIRQRQDYRKSMAAATFNFDLFDIDDPDNTVTQVLLYLEHQTVQVISTIQDLLSAIKKPDATRGELRENSGAISEVIRQMTEATNTSMNQTRNHQLREHGSWVVKSLEDCNHRMNALCKPNTEKQDTEFADRHFKQRLAGISFDIAKCTKELVKTVEEASLKEDIAHLDARLNHPDDLT